MVTLHKEEISVLFEQDPATEGNGGWQGLMVRLQRACDEQTGIINIPDKDLVRISKYAFDMGQGGWEDRLIKTFGRSLGPKLGR